MIIILSNGKQLRGDILKSAVYRSDLSPIPATVEAEIRIDDGLSRLLAEGKTIEVNGDLFYIIKSVKSVGREPQGQRDTSTISITGFLNNCHTVSFVRQKSIIKENATLAEIYRAAGAKIKAIDADFSIPRFSCFIGQTPTFQIGQILQEEGGVVRWKSGKIKFFRIPDLFKQKSAITIPNNADENISSEFKARHEVPWFYSLNPDGSFVYGNQSKSRTVRYTPDTNALRLHNMTRCLVRQKESKIRFSGRLAAGDLVDINGAKPLVIGTAAHIFVSGVDGSGTDQYTKLWLYGLST